MRPEKGDFRYKLILWIFIVSALLGLAGAIYSLRNLSSARFMFYFSAAWTAFYALMAYYWTDEERYSRFEYIMTPILFGVLEVFLLFLGVGGFTVLVPKIAAGENPGENLLALIIAEASIGSFAFFNYNIYLEEPIKELFKKKQGDPEDR